MTRMLIPDDYDLRVSRSAWRACALAGLFGLVIVVFGYAMWGCQATTSIKGGHSEASSTTSSTSLKITPQARPQEASRSTRVLITPIKETPCTTPASPETAASPPSSLAPASPPRARIVPRASDTASPRP